MKKIGLILLLTVFSVGIVLAQDAPSAKFSKITHDFGKVAEEIGQANCEFEFKNDGKTPLVINRVATSCGCTTPNYTKEPVLPGQKGVIKVSYSTTNRVGAFDKKITVFTNVPDQVYTLTIKGEVLPRK